MAAAKALLRNNPIFRNLSDDVIEQFLACAQPETRSAEDVFFVEQSEYDEIHCVLEGEAQAQVVLMQEAGRGATFGPGDLFGLETFVQEGVPIVNSTVAAVTDVKVLTWKVSDWRTICDEDPAVGYKVLMGVARMLHERIRKWHISLLDNVSWGIE
jgi:CRP/FNR family transcriptional regulator, cyclic AMP receptor protein